MAVIRQKATLKDIAQKTGYSVNTVSRALRNKDDIAQETREKIKQVALELGHINNTLASALRLGYTNTIAVILGDISNPHFSIMMKEIEGCAREQGYASFLLNTSEDEALELASIQLALNKSVDGILLCPTQKSARNVEYLRATGVPFVLIGRHFETLDTDYVVCNDELGGYQATKLLLEQGHRRILMLHGPNYISSARERLAGYRRAHEACGVPVDEALVQEAPVTVDDCRALLNGALQTPCGFTAVFVFSDLLAWDVWSCLRERNLHVPGDCSLIGFDHIQSRLSVPFKLTSVSSHKGRMSTEAANLLIRKIKADKPLACAHLVIDTSIAQGETVRGL